MLLFSLSIPVILCIVSVAILLIVAIVAVAIIATQKNKNNTSKNESTNNVDKVNVVDGVRYSTDDAVLTAEDKAKASHLEGDFILERGKNYTAQKGGILMPGKYTLLSSVDGVDKFNVRYNGFVREFSHGQSIIIAEGEQISAVSHTVILR